MPNSNTTTIQAMLEIAEAKAAEARELADFAEQAMAENASGLGDHAEQLEYQAELLRKQIRRESA